MCYAEQDWHCSSYSSFGSPANPKSVETSFEEHVRLKMAGILAKFVLLEVYRPKKLEVNNQTKKKESTTVKL